MSLTYFVVSQNRFVAFSNFVTDCDTKMKSANAKLVFSTPVLFESSNVYCSVVFALVKFVCQLIEHFTVFCSVHSSIQPGYTTCNCCCCRSGVSGALFVNSSVLPGGFTKTYPLTTNLPTRIVSWTLRKSCTTHVKCVSSGHVTESHYVAFFMYGAAFETTVKFHTMWSQPTTNACCW
jgi:hypothetical protein